MSFRGYKDLLVYKKSYSIAMEIFHISKRFPPEEKYSLTDQVRRSSRSVCANLAEAYRKRNYPKHLVSKLSDCDAEAAETSVHLDFAYDCGYLDRSFYHKALENYEEIGRMLGSMMNAPEKFTQKKGI